MDTTAAREAAEDFSHATPNPRRKWAGLGAALDRTAANLLADLRGSKVPENAFRTDDAPAGAWGKWLQHRGGGGGAVGAAHSALGSAASALKQLLPRSVSPGTAAKCLGLYCAAYVAGAPSPLKLANSALSIARRQKQLAALDIRAMPQVPPEYFISAQEARAFGAQAY